MKNLKLSSLLFFVFYSLIGQNDNPKFYLGASYGTAFSLGDFGNTEIDNPDAGFADNGTKIDLYGGYYLNDRITITGVIRYQTFDTEINRVIEDFNTANPGASFSGRTEDWQVYYLFLGASYKLKMGKKFAVFPRIGVGPMIAQNPGISVSAPNSNLSQNFNRSSETGFGLGVEMGIGLRTYLGKHFTLMPTFAFNRGFVTISNVVTTTDNVVATSYYQPKIQSFNLGLSLAYRFY